MSNNPNSEEFLNAVIIVKKLNSKPKDDEMLELYAHFKQATVGDVNIERPGMLDFKGKAKWDAWNGKKGNDKHGSEVAYIKLVSELCNTYGFTE